MNVREDVEDFVRLHRPHGELVGDVTEPTVSGYRVTIACPCGTTFVRHVAAGEPAVDRSMTVVRSLARPSRDREQDRRPDHQG